MSKKKITFLFGAGITPNKFPKTKEITDEVKGKKWIKGSDSIWRPNGLIYPSFKDAPKTLNALKKYLFRFSEEMKIYDKFARKEVNYEDIYFLAQQIKDTYLRQYENPLADRFIEIIKNEKELKVFFTEDKEFRKLIWKNAELLCELIEGVVVYKLNQRLPDLNYFDNLFKGLYKKYDLEIFSLNHDLLLEEYFSKRKIDFCDGFVQNNGHIQYDENEFEKRHKSIKIYKLHGSINWFLNEIYGNTLKGNGPYDETMRNGSRTNEWPRRILIGTFNKYYSYAENVFLGLLHKFSLSLNNSHLLVVSGYSFSDKAVNTLVYQNRLIKKRKVLVVDPEIDSLKKSARGVISKNWEKGAIIPLKKKFENLMAKDVVG